MDIACSFKQSNLIHGVERKGFRTSGFIHSNLGSRINGIGYRYLRSSRSVSRMCLSGNARRIGSVGGVSNGHLWGLLLRKPRVGGCENEIEMLGLVGPAQCQSSDALVFIDGNGRSVEGAKDLEEESQREESSSVSESNSSVGDEKEAEGGTNVDELRELLQKACRELEVARLNSTMFEEKAQKISESAIALKDQAENARSDVDKALKMIEELVYQEVNAKEAVQKATMALSLAEAGYQVALESVEAVRTKSVTPEGSMQRDLENEGEQEVANLLKQEEETLLVSQEEVKKCKSTLESCEAELIQLEHRKEELQKEVDRLNEAAEQAQINALKAEEDVTNIMLLAEQAVAFELEATQRVNDAEIALQQAEKLLSSSQTDVTDSTDQRSGPSLNEDVPHQEELTGQATLGADDFESKKDLMIEGASLASKSLLNRPSDLTSQSSDEAVLSDDHSDKENEKSGVEASKGTDTELEKVKTAVQAKKGETQKDMGRDSSPSNSPKA